MSSESVLYPIHIRRRLRTVNVVIKNGKKENFFKKRWQEQNSGARRQESEVAEFGHNPLFLKKLSKEQGTEYKIIIFSRVIREICV